MVGLVETGEPRVCVLDVQSAAIELLPCRPHSGDHAEAGSDAARGRVGVQIRAVAIHAGVELAASPVHIDEDARKERIEEASAPSINWST